MYRIKRVLSDHNNEAEKLLKNKRTKKETAMLRLKGNLWVWMKQS